MLNIGFGNLSWQDTSLKHFLAAQFPNAPSLDCEKTAFPKGFNAWSLQNAGIAVEFTDEFADHLKLVRDGDRETVLVFRQVGFLEVQVDRFVSSIPPFTIMKSHLTVW